MEWAKLNAAKSVIKSGSVMEVSKDSFEGAMGRVGAEFTNAVEIDVCDGAAAGELKVVVFFDGSRSSHRGARAAFESKMKESKESEARVESKESEGPTDTKVPEESKGLKAQVVEEALRGVKGPRLVRFHLAVAGARKAVWVPKESRLEIALRGMVVEAMDTENKKAGADDKKETQETEVPKKKEPEVPKKKETEVAMAPEEKKEPEGPKPQEPMETKVPKKKAEPMAPKAEKAAELRAKAAEAAEAAERAAREAEEAEAAAEEEAAAERESEREKTKEALKRARQTLERVREEVEDLERQLKQQNDVERRKRKRREQGESPRRRVWARKEEKEEKEKEEIVMVDDRQFREAVGEYDGPVHRVWVGRFEPSGPGGIGPVRGGEMVLESVYCSGAEAAELLARFAKRKGGTGGDVVVKEFTDVKVFDAWMEENEFVKRTLDVESRCMNPEGPMEPVSGEDTERVWVKRGSAELAALDKLIAKARARSRKWQCPDSPRSPVYAYAPRSPVEDDDDDHDETSCVD